MRRERFDVLMHLVIITSVFDIFSGRETPRAGAARRGELRNVNKFLRFRDSYYIMRYYVLRSRRATLVLSALLKVHFS